jgi:hypothetical protein
MTAMSTKGTLVFASELQRQLDRGLPQHFSTVVVAVLLVTVVR